MGIACRCRKHHSCQTSPSWTLLQCSAERDLGVLQADARGFIAKVSDFGLSKLVADATMAATAQSSSEASGTVTHMAPETLAEGKASPASDVYAFGILSVPLPISHCSSLGYPYMDCAC